MRLLAIETSCDETSAAVIVDGCAVSMEVSSQIKIHAEYGGVVPELATREHLRNLAPVVQNVLQQSQIKPTDLNAIAATRGPGLPPALMVGWKAAQSMSYALNVPLMGVNHVQAHLYSPWFTSEPPVADWGSLKPNLSLIVSGGHTLLVKVDAPLKHQILGGTQDDAAGECFDKIAKLLGLDYPGGPEVDRLACTGNPTAFEFARPMLNQPKDACSFSGLKTSGRYFLEKHPELAVDNARLPDLCASAQAAIVEVLVNKTIRAAKRERVQCLTLSGGVANNSELRRKLQSSCKENDFNLRLASPDLCTDNAAMVGLLAERQIAEGKELAPLEMDFKPGWVLGD